jgi:hypothetical protein
MVAGDAVAKAEPTPGDDQPHPPGGGDHAAHLAQDCSGRVGQFEDARDDDDVEQRLDERQAEWVGDNRARPCAHSPRGRGAYREVGDRCRVGGIEGGGVERKQPRARPEAKLVAKRGTNGGVDG